MHPSVCSTTYNSQDMEAPRRPVTEKWIKKVRYLHASGRTNPHLLKGEKEKQGRVGGSWACWVLTVHQALVTLPAFTTHSFRSP